MGLRLLQLGGLILAAGCGRELDLRLELVATQPDPFADIRTVVVRARVEDRIVRVGEGRWDQGPLDLPVRIDPGVSRLVVQGLDAGRRVRASGATGPLDLLRDPPDGALRIRFARLGELSRVEGSLRVRRGGRAARLPGGKALVLGGRDGNGVAIEETEILGVHGVRAGPRIPGGRTGDFSAVVLPGGDIFLAGGAPGDRAVLIDGGARSVRTIALPAELRADATRVAVDDGLVVWAGGSEGTTVEADVWGLDLGSGQVRRLGQLDGPRVGATGFASMGRAVFVGGRSVGTLPGAPALADATVFVPARGTSLSERVGLPQRLLRPPGVVLDSGSILLVGGGRSDTASTAQVLSLVVKSERDVPLGDAATVTALPAPVARAEVASTVGGVLVLPSSGEPAFVRMLPRRVELVLGSREEEGALVGAAVADGLFMLRSEAGGLFVYNPGVAWLLGPAAGGGRLRDDANGIRLTPLRPAAWQLTQEGLVGRAPSRSSGPVAPADWVLVDDARRADVEMSVDVRLATSARAALLFGFEGPDRFDFVVLSGRVSVERAGPRGLRIPVACPSVQVPALLTPRFHRVRLIRTGDRVHLDVGGDGGIDLTCETPDPRPGFVAFGVVTGQVRFDNLYIARPGS